MGNSDKLTIICYPSAESCCVHLTLWLTHGWTSPGSGTCAGDAESWRPPSGDGGAGGKKYADNISIGVVSSAWRGGSPCCSAVKQSGRRGDGSGATATDGNNNSATSRAGNTTSLVWPATSGVSAMGLVPAMTRVISQDGVRISEHLVAKRAAGAHADVSATVAAEAFGRALQLPERPERGRARRNLTLTSGLSCTVDVGGTSGTTGRVPRERDRINQLGCARARSSCGDPEGA
jgi:hypothetical protein